MIFNEIYSAYYNTVAKLLGAIIEGERDEKALERIVAQNAFGESMLTVLPALKGGKWQLMNGDMTTLINQVPTMPLTIMQKRWLKAISLDERIRLFGLSFDSLEGVEPLFDKDDHYIYDKYSDKDPYGDPDYIERFRVALEAIEKKIPLAVKANGKKGREVLLTVLPKKLEYSEKDDKFRLVCANGRSVNLCNITELSFCKETFIQQPENTAPPLAELSLRVCDERNALERCLLHFAHFEKRVEKLDEKNYTVCLKYDKSDESELVIRVLSFGQMVEVLKPESFKELIKERLVRQKSCGLV